MAFTLKINDFINESYYYTKHKSGLDVYVIPKEMSTSYAIFGTKFGSIDNRFICNGKEINLPDGSEKKTTLFCGYCVVHNNNAVIIVEAGERPEEIDFERAEEAKKRAEERLRGGEGIDKNRAEQALYRSIARLELYKDK